MKRLISIGIGILAVTTATAQEAVGPWKFGISSRFRFEDSNYFDLNERKQFSHIRIRPTINYESESGTKIVLEPQYVKILGLQITGTPPTETSGNSTYTGSLDTLWMRQAYMDIKLSDEVKMQLGRQMLSFGDQVIIGQADWGVYGRTFDTVRFKWAKENSAVEVFQAKIAEITSSVQVNGSDKDLTGIHASFSPHEKVKTWDLYYFYQSDNRNPTVSPADASRSTYFGTYGTRFVTSFGNFEWKFEYAKNYGEENSAYMTDDKKNDMIDTTLSTSLDETKKHKVGFQFFTAGENWRELYPTTHSHLGRNDLLGRRNLTGISLFHNAKWSDLWSTDVYAYSFQRTGKNSTSFSTNGTTAVGAGGLTSKDIGTEIDLAAKYQLQKETTLSVGTAFFQYGKYLKDSTAKDKNPHFAYFMVESKF